MTKIKPLAQWWVTPKLPIEHIFIPPEKRPKEIYEIFRVYFRKWLVHPIKRRIARFYLKFLQQFCGLSVIGITGSAGKTTTKEMIASILKQKGETVASYANIDPVYNIPTTILKCRPSTKYLVLEMGVEFIGEMDFYLWLAQPEIGVITNIYPTHTEFFDSVAGVFKEKSTLVKKLSSKGCAVLNSENKYLKRLVEDLKTEVIWFGKNGKIKAENTEFNKDLGTKYTLVLDQSKIDVQIPILGYQFVQNSLAAVAVGYICGVRPRQIRKGLKQVKCQEHRMKIIKLKSGALVIDDSYNNNPAAAREALKVFVEISGKRKKIVVFGDMLELGKLEKKYHRELGREIPSCKIDYLIGVGRASKDLCHEAKKKMDNSVSWIETQKEVMPVLRPLLKKNTAVLIKGSRSIGLDKVVKSLS